MTYPEFLSPFVFSPAIPIRWYGLMYIVGILSAYMVLKWSQEKGYLVLLTRKDKNGNKTENGGIFDMLFYAAFASIVGARIGFFLFYSPQTLLSPWEILGFSFGHGGLQFHGFAGMSAHGGVVGMITGCILFAKKYNYSIYMIIDNATLAICTAVFFGRLGNFLNAELYGRVTDSFLGMRFPLYDRVGGYEAWIEMEKALRPYTEPRHPSQLYEAFLEGIVLSLILYLLAKNKKVLPGTRTWACMLLYGLFRTLVETVREITEWDLGITLTAGMIYSIPMIIVGTVMLIRLYTKKPNDINKPDNTNKPKNTKKLKAAK